MPRPTPVRIRIAIEHKAIMTEHGKQRLNRKRDLEAHHDHLHRDDDQAIAAGTFVINASPTFRSRLRPEGIVTEPADPVTLVTMVLDALKNVTEADGVGQIGLDAKGALVVSMDNIHWDATTYMTEAPAPQLVPPLHWTRSSPARVTSIAGALADATLLTAYQPELSPT